MNIVNKLDTFKYIVMVHLHYDEVFRALYKLYESLLLDAFDVKIAAPLTACSSYKNGISKKPDVLTFVFDNVDGRIVEAKRTLLLLVNELHGITDQIIIKFNNKGYLVDKDGDILESWELYDDMS